MSSDRGLSIDEVEERLQDLKRRMEAIIALNNADLLRLETEDRRREEFMKSLDRDRVFRSGWSRPPSIAWQPLRSSVSSASTSISNQGSEEHEHTLNQSFSSYTSSSFSSEESSMSDTTGSSARAHSKSTKTAQSAMRMEAIRELNHIQETKIRGMLRNLRQRMGSDDRENDLSMRSHYTTPSTFPRGVPPENVSIYPPDAQSV